MAHFEEADLRTLALAAPEVSAEGLDGFLRYQETLLSLAHLPLVSAHTVALQASGLDARDLPGLRALCDSFAGKRSAAQDVAERLRVRPPAGAEEVVRWEAHLRDLRASAPWIQRYGPERYRLLEEREAALVRLHRALQQARLQPPALPV